MCYGRRVESPGSPPTSLGLFRPTAKPGWEDFVSAVAGKVAGGTPRAGETSEGMLAGTAGDCPWTMEGMRPDVKQDTDHAHKCPRKAPAKKSKEANKGSSSSSSSGSPSGSAPSPSSPSAGSGGAGAGAPGGPPPPGKGPDKTPADATGPSPRKRRRRTRSSGKEPEESVSAATETADEAAAALSALEKSPSSSMATLKTTRQVRADAAAARKKKREELAKKAKEDAAAAAAAAATAAAQGTPQPPAFQKPTASSISKAATRAVSTASATAAAPSRPSGFPQYLCHPDCTCNQMGREKLREKVSTGGTELDHQRENLDFMRWVQLRRDNAEIKEQLRTNNALLTSQNEMLKEILENAKEAATVRASVDLAADDKGELGMPWTDMDQSVAAFSTMAKRQMLYRILHRIVCKECHFPRMAMLEMFAPPLQQRVYPIAKPATHSKRNTPWRYGKRYHILPKVTLDFISFVMSKKYGKTSDIYAKEVKDHLNDARDTAAGEDKATFYGKLDEPIYLLVWRDSDAKVYVIEETPPFDGDDEAKDAFVARWQDAVDEAIADKHPNGFHHKNPPRE